jgi:hypothetical protein
MEVITVVIDQSASCKLNFCSEGQGTFRLLQKTTFSAVLTTTCRRSPSRVVRFPPTTCTLILYYDLYLSPSEFPTKLCKICGFHSSGYERCRLLVYENLVATSQETCCVSVTEPSWLMLCKL